MPTETTKLAREFLAGLLHPGDGSFLKSDAESLTALLQRVREEERGRAVEAHGDEWEARLRKRDAEWVRAVREEDPDAEETIRNILRRMGVKDE